MTPPFPMSVPGQRAAEEFDSVLAGRATADVTPALLDRYADLFATVQVLHDRPEVMPRAEFVTDLRERLMLAAPAEMVPAAPVVRRLPDRTRRRRRLATATAALVMVGGGAGMAAAASGAMPGESLYPIKRGVEQLTVASRLGDAAEGSTLLDQAATRLDEVESLLAADTADGEALAATAESFRSSAGGGADRLFAAFQDGGDIADIVAVRTFAASAMDQVTQMAAGADPGEAAVLRDVADTVADIDQQASVLCAACSSGEALTPPDALAAGAGAQTVQNLIGRPTSQAEADIARARAATAKQTRVDLGGLTKVAQGKADDLAEAGGTGSAAGAAGKSTTPLATTVTASGEVVPVVTKATGTAVKNLLGGVTTSVGSALGGATGSTSGSGAASGVGGAVDDTVDGLTGTVGGLTGGPLGGN